jgi:tripartite-type tricarboxylate transporter receptor subunit TctC
MKKMRSSFIVDAARRRALRLLAATAATGAGLVAAPAAHAQEFPQKGPVRIVVPFPPGGAVDALARVVATQLALKWKQSVVVDNKPGGNQIIGSQLVANAPPDGYTILLATTGHAVNATLIEKLPYDPLKDFTPLTLSATAPNILVTTPSTPAPLQQFIAHLRANPRKLNASHPAPRPR